MEENKKELYTELLNTIDIVETIRKYIALTQPANTYFEGKCPFDSRCGKSLVVDPIKKSWYCFGCHARGDVITFIARIGDMNRTTAAKFLRNLQKSKEWEQVEKKESE